MTEAPLLKGFDVTSDAGLLADYWKRWDELQSDHRVFQTDAGPDPIWVLMNYADVHDALQDPELFSSSCSMVTDVAGSHQWIPTELDGDIHRKYRSLLLPWFSPAAVRALEPKIRKRCTDLIEPLVDDGDCDFVSQIAEPLPTSIFMDMMGLPSDRSEELIRWTKEFMHTPIALDPDDTIKNAAALNISGFLRELSDARRAEPREDLASALVAAQIEGEPISEADLAQVLFLLYLGGLDTVTSELSAMMLHLAGDSDLQRVVAGTTSAVPAVVEELLRAYGVSATGRVVTRDVEWKGCPMRAGDRLLLALPAAGRDPQKYESPTTVDVDRGQSRHLSFGLGPHRCLGSTLARAELRIALEEWHRRIPEYELNVDKPIERYSGVVTGFTSLPLKW